MVRKKRMRKSFLKSIPNRLGYTLIVILFIVLLGIGVYALTPGVAPNPGHTLATVAPPSPCSSGQVIVWDGVNLVCSTPSVTDSRFTVNSNGELCWDIPATCSLEGQVCSGFLFFDVVVSNCDYSTEQEYDDWACLDFVNSNYEPACAGTNLAQCSGYTNAWYTSCDATCRNSATIRCTCLSSGSYMNEVYNPAGPHCVF